MIHELKTDPEVFQSVLEGKKTYEIRKNDRNFQVGDELHLKETVFTGEEMNTTDPAKYRALEYTGRCIARYVTHILQGPVYGLMDGWCIMSISDEEVFCTMRFNKENGEFEVVGEPA